MNLFGVLMLAKLDFLELGGDWEDRVGGVEGASVSGGVSDEESMLRPGSRPSRHVRKTSRYASWTIPKYLVQMKNWTKLVFDRITLPLILGKNPQLELRETRGHQSRKLPCLGMFLLYSSFNLICQETTWNFSPLMFNLE